MQHLQLLDVAARAARERICTQCYQRPPGSESLHPEVPRACEPKCPVFVHLPKLLKMSHEPAAEPEQIVRGAICQRCALSPSAGEYCSEYLARTCPLSRYSAELIAVLAHVREFPPAPPAPPAAATAATPAPADAAAAGRAPYNSRLG